VCAAAAEFERVVVVGHEVEFGLVVVVVEEQEGEEVEVLSLVRKVVSIPTTTEPRSRTTAN